MSRINASCPDEHTFKKWGRDAHQWAQRRGVPPDRAKSAYLRYLIQNGRELWDDERVKR